MAKKWYRSLVESTGDPRGEVLVGGAAPGEVFTYDYARRGYNERVLIENGVIEEIPDPSKEDLVLVAERLGIAEASKKTKDELKAAIEAAGEE